MHCKHFKEAHTQCQAPGFMGWGRRAPPRREHTDRKIMPALILEHALHVIYNIFSLVQNSAVSQNAKPFIPAPQPAPNQPTQWQARPQQTFPWNT